MNLPLLRVDSLKTQFSTDEGVVTAVDGISFDVEQGETLGIVGESGCGKSVTALSIMRLLPEPVGQTVAGTVELNGRNLLDLSAEEMRSIRGNRISMIFQEPMTSLNPVFTVGDQIEEALYSHVTISRKDARARCIELLDIVGIPSPDRRAESYPFQLSGGMRQRVMIAMALACGPDVLIADEPTTALDVTIQAQILDLVRRLRDKIGMAMIWISHDLGVIAELADRVAVMYAGQIIESTTAENLFNGPKHPYTNGLLRSIPLIDKNQESLEAIPGIVPSPKRMPSGCRFHPRCRMARDICRSTAPELTQSDHAVRCLQYTPEWEVSNG